MFIMIEIPRRMFGRALSPTVSVFAIRNLALSIPPFPCCFCYSANFLPGEIDLTLRNLLTFCLRDLLKVCTSFAKYMKCITRPLFIDRTANGLSFSWKTFARWQPGRFFPCLGHQPVWFFGAFLACQVVAVFEVNRVDLLHGDNLAEFFIRFCLQALKFVLS